MAHPAAPALTGALLALLTAGCANGEDPAPAPATVTRSVTVAADPSPTTSPSASASTHLAPPQTGPATSPASTIEEAVTRGTIVLTSDDAAPGGEALEGKLVIGRGGCLSFVRVGGQEGPPSPLVLPAGSSYDGRGSVVVEGRSRHLGEIVTAVPGPAVTLPSQAARRCGGPNVAWWSAR